MKVYPEKNPKVLWFLYNSLTNTIPWCVLFVNCGTIILDFAFNSQQIGFVTVQDTGYDVVH
jgi:hypothetical protein